MFVLVLGLNACCIQKIIVAVHFLVESRVKSFLFSKLVAEFEKHNKLQKQTTMLSNFSKLDKLSLE